MAITPTGPRSPITPSSTYGVSRPATPVAVAPPFALVPKVTLKTFGSLDEARKAAPALPEMVWEQVDTKSEARVLNLEKVNQFLNDFDNGSFVNDVPHFPENPTQFESNLKQTSIASLSAELPDGISLATYFTKDSMFAKVENPRLNSDPKWSKRDYAGDRITVAELVQKLQGPLSASSGHSSFSEGASVEPGTTSLSTPSAPAEARVPQRDVF
ncbi:MAG TPA: hypothetical protein VEY30_08165 [Myxococcaceae bacterium]|nr:hypothetical protein [Myxococcaceae bacterium]